MEIDELKIYQVLTKKLGSNIKLHRVSKTYSLSDNFICKTSDRIYFCKIGSKNKISNHINGERMINKYLPIPKTLSPIYEIGNDTFLYLQECCDGKLLAYLIDKYNNEKIIQIEKSKEILLSNLYKSTLKYSKISDYLSSNSQELFINRITGDRFSKFFGKDTEIARLCLKQIFINNKKIPITVDDIFKLLLKKIEFLKENSSESLLTIVGHADLHHGNIIVDRTKVHVIDPEYASEFVTPNMDIAKPYYNDLIGVLFFHHQAKLEESLNLEFNETDSEIYIDVKEILIPKVRIDITKIKIQYRKTFFDFSSNIRDLSIVDYLIMCHTLNRNPSLYPKKIQIIFIYILYSIYYMDWEKPESLFYNKFIFQ